MLGDVVDGGRRAGGEADAEGGRDQNRQRHGAGRGEEHADHGGKHDQADDSRFAEFGVVAPVG